jgi:iron complex outermembrane recepter protein
MCIPLRLVSCIPIFLGLQLSPAFLIADTVRDSVLEEVLVIGSHIPRQDYVSASPLFTVEMDAIQLDGSVTLAEYLNRYPQFRPGFTATSVNPGDGTSNLNLRGLGPERTLTLLNGQRLGPAGANGVVDINALPSALVERVEILTGGATTAYGSDAIAGAVNISLRRDLEGLELSGAFNKTDRGDGDTGEVTLAGGTTFAKGLGTVSGFVGYTDRDFVAANQRSLSAVKWESNLQTGDLTVGGSPHTPATHLFGAARIGDEFAEQGLTFDSNGNVRAYTEDDFYNFQDRTYLQYALERATAGVFSEYIFGENLLGHIDLLYSNNQSDSDIAPAPVTPGAPLTFNVDNPGFSSQAQRVLTENFQPGPDKLLTLPTGWRAESLGPRRSEVERESYSVNLGLEGRWLSDWQWDFDYVRSETEVNERLLNAISDQRLRQALLVDPETGECFDSSNGCVAANIFGEGNVSPQAADFIRFGELSNRSTTQQEVVSLVTTGTVEIAHYDFELAVGAQWRRDEADFDPDPRIASGGQIGFNPSSAIGGSIEVSEVFVEAVLPLLEGRPWVHSLQAELGYRYSDYSTVGTNKTYKYGLMWQPGETVLLRTMFQRAVRAPNIGDLFTAQSEFRSLVGFWFVSDPCSAEEDPIGNGFTELCTAQGIPESELGTWERNFFAPFVAFENGEQELEEEEADTFTVGVTWQPEIAAGLSIALDYYDIDISGAIEGTSETEVTRLCFLANDPEDKFCRALRRGPDYDIAEVDLKLHNFGELSTTGIDLAIDYQLDMKQLYGQSSSVSLSVMLNHAMDYVVQVSPIAPRYKCAGYFGFPCTSYPEYRSLTRAAWYLGPIVSELSWHWVDGMKNAAELFVGESYLKPLTVESYNYFDLNFSWEITDRLQVFAGITNLTDKDPPLLGGIGAEQGNTDPGQYDVLGRRYHASFSLRF